MLISRFNILSLCFLNSGLKYNTIFSSVLINTNTNININNQENIELESYQSQASLYSNKSQSSKESQISLEYITDSSRYSPISLISSTLGHSIFS